MADIRTPTANDSDFKTKAWLSQQTAWTLVYDLWQSPLYIREQGEKYLERFRKEKPEKYAERKSRSVPRNKFRESIETMAGMVFKTDPAPEQTPPALAELFTDIDACGNSLHSFLIDAFERRLRDGGGAIFVDATPLSETARKRREAGEPVTGADRQGDRPFWRFIEARQIINHRYEKIGGIDTLVQATIEMCEIEADGEFGEKEVKRHYILRRGSFEVRRFDVDKSEWILEPDKGGNTGLTEIPLVPLAPFGTAPPLLDLAMLTIQYYNKESDLDNWCHVACVPQRITKVASENDVDKFKKATAAVETGLIIWGEHAEVKYLEVTGSGIEAAQKRLDVIDARMSAIGVGMLAPTDIAPRSATEVIDTAGQRQSKLARYAREFENCVEKAFYFTSEYLKAIGGSSVNLDQAENTSLKLTMDFDRLTFSLDQWKLLSQLFENGDLSHETFFELLPTFIDMPAGWTWQKEIERLSKTAPVISAGKQPNEPDGQTTSTAA